MTKLASYKLIAVSRYGVPTLEDPIADLVRKAHCLCLTCSRRREDGTYDCPMANVFFEQCQAHGMAMCVTRCAEYEGLRKEVRHDI